MRWARDDVVDRLVEKGEVLVLTSRECVRLSTLPAAILEHLAEPRTEEDLTSHLEDRFGSAPPGRLEEILGELTRRRLIHLTSGIVPSD